MSTVSELVALFPKLGRYRKLGVAWLTTTAPFLAWLLSGVQDAPSIVMASFAYLLANFGVYGISNDPVFPPVPPDRPVVGTRVGDIGGSGI